MKITRQKYVLASLAAALVVTGMTFASIGFAQTYGPVSCGTATPTVGVNQTAIFTASGGNGAYSWSGQNLNLNNPTGTQFSVSYPSPGTYTVNVMSSGQIAGCTVTVVGSVPTGSISCSPASQNVTLGQTAYVSASGGTGTYTWSSPDLLINNPNGSGFNANYATVGTKTITVSSGNGTSAACTVNVLASGTAVTNTPGLPNTGGGYGQ